VPAGDFCPTSVGMQQNSDGMHNQDVDRLSGQPSPAKKNPRDTGIKHTLLWSSLLSCRSLSLCSMVEQQSQLIKLHEADVLLICTQTSITCAPSHSGVTTQHCQLSQLRFPYRGGAAQALLAAEEETLARPPLGRY